jgi:hypothetical protein
VHFVKRTKQRLSFVKVDTYVTTHLNDPWDNGYEHETEGKQQGDRHSGEEIQVSGILHFLEALYPWYVAYHIPKGFYPI